MACAMGDGIHSFDLASELGMPGVAHLQREPCCEASHIVSETHYFSPYSFGLLTITVVMSPTGTLPGTLSSCSTYTGGRGGSVAMHNLKA